MPNATTRQTLARQWEILKALPRHGAGMAASDMENHLRQLGFEVSNRQLQRDLKALAESFSIECNDKGKPYGWRWAAGTALDLSGLTAAEAVSLCMIEQAVTPLLPAAIVASLLPRFEQARLKLASLGEEKAAAMAAAFRCVSHGTPLKPPVIDADALQCVQEALAASEQVQVRYRSAALLQAAEAEGQSSLPEPVAMRLHPLALISRGPATYLLATCGNYSDPRLYAMQRVAQAERTYEDAVRPAGFQLDDWLAANTVQFGSGQTVALRARIEPGLAAILRETPLADDQTIEPANGLLCATVPDTMQLHWWILGQGADIEVLEPPELRARIAHTLQEALGQYQAVLG